MRSLSVPFGILAVSALGVAPISGAETSYAQGPRGSNGRSQGGALTEALGQLHWGMRKQELLAVFEREIEADFREQLADVRGAVEEDRLLQTIEDRKRRLRDGWVAFDGQRTGWDVSFIGLEYTHGNQEAMLRIHEPGSQVQEFYFFIRGRFWKWFRAFDREAFGGLSFEEVGYGLEQRHGPSNLRYAPQPGEDDFFSWLEWSDGVTRLRAIDETRFYSFYCLAYESIRTADRIDQLRTNTIRRGRRRGRSILDAVTNRRGEEDRYGANADIVDRLTGGRGGAGIEMPDDEDESDGEGGDDRSEQGY